MLKKMNEKKNNKGFSLVELIVVILIMAVLAVALAPQVMKWVGNSRIAADTQAQDDVAALAQLALADTTKYGTNTAYDDAKNKTYTITVDADGLEIAQTSPTPAAIPDAFTKAFMTALGETTNTVVESTKVKRKNTASSGANMVVTVANGVVTKTPLTATME